MNLRDGQRGEATRAGGGGLRCAHQGRGGSETRGEGQGQQGGLPYLKTALCVCSLSSPLTRHEKRPKDSVPERERQRGRLREALEGPARLPSPWAPGVGGPRLELETEQPPLAIPSRGEPGKAPTQALGKRAVPSANHPQTLRLSWPLGMDLRAPGKEPACSPGTIPFPLPTHWKIERCC